MAVTPRLGLEKVATNVPVDIYRNAVNDLADTLDNAVIFTADVLAVRPDPGLPGRFFFATDTFGLYLDNGASWVAAPIPAGAITPTMLAAGIAPVFPNPRSGDYSPDPGEWVQMSGGHTVTLPNPAIAEGFLIVQSLDGTGAAPCVVSGATIVGPGIPAVGVSSILLGSSGAFVVLESDQTNWNIVAGQQDSGWVALTLATNVISSGTTTAAARLKGDRVELRGALGNNTGGGITTPWATIAATAARPAAALTIVSASVVSSTWTLNPLLISTGGVLASSVSVANTGNYPLDGLSFPVG